jgi:hypothetical protein
MTEPTRGSARVVSATLIQEFNGGTPLLKQYSFVNLGATTTQAGCPLPPHRRCAAGNPGLGGSPARYSMLKLSGAS